MNRNEIKITFQPSGRNVYVLPGTLLIEAAGRAGIILQTPCGGEGTCGKCKVRIIGDNEVLPQNTASLTGEQVQNGFRLACQTHLEKPVTVEIPAASLFEATEQILTNDTGHTSALNPVVRKTFFNLGEPSGIDIDSDATRLLTALGTVNIPIPLLRELPGFLRNNNWKGTAVIIGDSLASLEADEQPGNVYGVAIDLGTTTIVATLFDLATGDNLSLASTMNPQVSYGDDVIARISKIRENIESLTELQQVAVTAINNLIQTLSKNASVPTDQIFEIVIAGNSTMQQILCGLDPSALGEVPFVQVFDAPLTLPAEDIGVNAGKRAEMYIFPQIGGFVGGDTVAGILASRMQKVEKPTLLVDIGTNGEIVLARNGKMQSTSTAAGPAFEGARIVQGMRATAGAIEKVVIRDDVIINVIGNTQPSGLCGTALIDAVAEMLRNGIIDTTGRILDRSEAPHSLSDSLKNRLVELNGQVNFLLVPADESSSGEPIYLWQKDVRELQLATGAIRAGINILLRRINISPEELDAVLLAGAFGNFIRRNNARRIGLLPQIPTDRIHFIGNAASLGAKLALLSRDERQAAAEIISHAEHVDLSLDPEFQMEFGMAMMFPDGDIT